VKVLERMPCLILLGMFWASPVLAQDASTPERNFMSLQALADLSEIASAIAVLVTLAYLAVQVKQANEQLFLAARQARADAAREILASVSETEYLAPIFAKMKDFSWVDFGLESKEDTARIAAWCHAWMRTEEHNYGALAGEERATQDQLLLMWLSTSWGVGFWQQVKGVYDAGFVTYMDELERRLLADPRSTWDLFSRR